MGIKSIKVVELCAAFVFAVMFSCPLTASAETKTTPEKEKPISQETKTQKERRRLIDFSVELLTSAHGQQTFDVIDSDGALVSRLKYPHRGQAMIFKGELYVLPRLSVGGRYSSSSVLQLKNSTSTDTDWKSINNLVEIESNSQTKTEVNFFDVNLYGRLLDLEKGKYTGIAGKITDYLLIGQKSKLAFDLFGGYQYQQGRYGTFDMMQTVEDYQKVGYKVQGENSFYKSVYRGPRIGARGEYIYDRFSLKGSFAYAWLKTKSSGFWSLRDYPFYQHGDGHDGYGIDLQTELSYQITKHISAGFGYNFNGLYQHKMKESGNDPSGGGSYTDYDIIRNTDSVLYGPTVFVRANW